MLIGYRAGLGRLRATLPGSVRQWLLLTLLLLALTTIARFYHRQRHYQLRVFPTATGWGYSVLDDGTPRIYQPTIPGRAGRAGFSSQQQARRVGEHVIQKLQQGQHWPTLTPTELRQLGLSD